MSNNSLETEEDIAGLLDNLESVDSPGASDAADLLGVAGEINEFAEQATEKVQLDTDDAMFLAEAPEPEVVPEVEKAAEVSEESVEEPAKPLPRSLIAGVLVVILACIVGIVWLVYYKPTSALSLVPASPTVVVVTSPKGSSLSEEMVITLAPFMIEHRRDGKVDFLETQFALVVEGKLLHRDISEKTLLLRDAIYYYLLNQDENFLFDPKNISLVKSALEDIINGHLGPEKLTEFLIVQYLIR